MSTAHRRLIDSRHLRRSTLTFGVAHEQEIEAQMSDGTILRADVWRPEAPGRYPVLLMRTPYGKAAAQDSTYAHPWWWARCGYAVVVQDTRGRYSSDGVFVPFEGEADDTEDTVALCAQLPFSNGRVAMYGFSYPGAVQLQGAVRRPESLTAIAPAMTQADFYEGWAYHNGAFSLAFNASWATLLAQDVARRRGDARLELDLMNQLASMPGSYGTLPLRDFPNLGEGGPGSFFQDWLGHDTRDHYWQKLDVRERLPDIDCAALVIAGLWDAFLEGNLEAYRRMREGSRGSDTRLIVGPWYHVPWIQAFGEVDHGPNAANDVSEWQLSFFDQWLRDGDALDGSRVRAFVTGVNSWQGFADWPPQSTVWVLFLSSSARANSLSGAGMLSEEPPGAERPDVFSYDPSVPVPSLGGRSCCVEGVAPIGPADQRIAEMMNQVLVYTSPALARDRLVAGKIRAHLFAATSAADTDWTIKVCDVFPDGRSINVQESIQRARFHGGDSATTLIPPAEIREFVIDVGTCCHVFRSGHAIRVEISSSNFPQWDRNLNTGHPIGVDTISDRVIATQYVFHDSEHPARIVLPTLE